MNRWMGGRSSRDAKGVFVRSCGGKGAFGGIGVGAGRRRRKKEEGKKGEERGKEGGGGQGQLAKTCVELTGRDVFMFCGLCFCARPGRS